MDPLSQNPVPPVVPPSNPGPAQPADTPVTPAIPEEPFQPGEAPAPSEAPAENMTGQVVAALQNSKNVLVAVKANPSIDELASALAFTFLLGKLDKHATAVFSGKIPPAIEFLDPEKVFEDTVDSLRDFIIALDKEKADKLRYKVEDDVVKVFITPYKTVISEKDLQFSQGDFNVDVVVALGVIGREELDKAIIAHGRILHDATVVTINSGPQQSSLGAIDWHNAEASSIAEMIIALHDSLGGNMLDAQISTALLTGLVAETNRFSNDKTTPKVMNIAAQLMAAGANQQLVATNLRQEGMLSQSVRESTKQEGDDDGEMKLDHAEAKEPVKKNQPSKELKTDEKSKPGTDKAASDLEDTVAKISTKKANKPAPKKPVESTGSKKVITPIQPPKNADDSEPVETIETSDTEAASSTSKSDSLPVIEPLPSLADNQEVKKDDELPSITPIQPNLTKEETTKPGFGGALNATTVQAEEAKAAEAEKEASENHTTLSHDAQAEAENKESSVEEARKNVEEATEAVPFDPANQPLEAINAEPLPSLGNANSTAVDTNVSQVQSTPATPPAEEPSPVEAFMQPQGNPNELTQGFKVDSSSASHQTPPLPPVDQSGLPPLPPMPSAPVGTAPPLPPLPGQPVPVMDQVVQPQINPGFMQDMPQSQNNWTQAADDLATKQADKQAVREAKAAEMDQQYNQTVDRQRELQGLPPLNDPKGSGLPPVPPQV